MDDFYRKAAFSCDFDVLEAIWHEIMCNIFLMVIISAHLSPVVQYFSDIQNTTQMRMRAKSSTTVDSDHLIYTSAPIQRSMLL